VNSVLGTGGRGFESRHSDQSDRFARRPAVSGLAWSRFELPYGQAPAPHPTLATPRLRLRQFRNEDVDAMHECFANPEAMRFWNTPVHSRRIETARASVGLSTVPRPTIASGRSRTPRPISASEWSTTMTAISAPSVWTSGDQRSFLSPPQRNQPVRLIFLQLKRGLGLANLGADSHNSYYGT
jgi:hypothetical protein